MLKAAKAEAARKTAEDQLAETSKETIMLNLEIKENQSQYKMEITRLENLISSLEDQNGYALREQVRGGVFCLCSVCPMPLSEAAI